MRSRKTRAGPFNIAELCTRRQCSLGRGGRTALRWVASDGARRNFSFFELEGRSNRAANALEGLGLRPGDPVFVVLPKMPEQFEAILGALKARLLCGVLYHNFGDKGLCDRLADAGAKALVTTASLYRRCREGLSGLRRLKHTLIVDEPPAAERGLLSYARLCAGASARYACAPTSPDDPSILHYTSGSTGSPKGVVHSHGTVAAQRETAAELLGLRPGDLFWCTADLGWVMGTSYGLIGPWSLGVTQLHYGGAYDAAAWMDLLERERVSVLYTSPTSLRMLMREDPRIHAGRHLPALRAIFSAGEPLNPEVLRWAKAALGRDVFDSWFQTEIAAMTISNRPGDEIRPGSMGRAVAGVHAAILGPCGEARAPGEIGQLAIGADAPAMFRAYMGRRAAFRAKFKSGWYLTGDKARMDRDGYVWFVGRNDDVINTAGHLVSPFEVESAALELPEIAEAAAVGGPDPLLHERVVLFLRLKGAAPSRGLALRVRLHVSRRVSSVATPQDIRFVESIPKTQSGKILRGSLRSLCARNAPRRRSRL